MHVCSCVAIPRSWTDYSYIQSTAVDSTAIDAAYDSASTPHIGNSPGRSANWAPLPKATRLGKAEVWYRPAARVLVWIMRIPWRIRRSTHPSRLLSTLDLNLNVDEVQLSYKTLEWLSRERLGEPVGLHSRCRRPFNVDIARLNFLPQPVLVYVDVAQFSR